MPQHIQNDVDLQTLPLFAFHEQVVKSPKQFGFLVKYQVKNSSFPKSKTSTLFSFFLEISHLHRPKYYGWNLLEIRGGSQVCLETWSPLGLDSHGTPYLNYWPSGSMALPPLHRDRHELHDPPGHPISFSSPSYGKQ